MGRRRHPRQTKCCKRHVWEMEARCTGRREAKTTTGEYPKQRDSVGLKTFHSYPQSRPLISPRLKSLPLFRPLPLPTYIYNTDPLSRPNLQTTHPLPKAPTNNTLPLTHLLLFLLLLPRSAIYSSEERGKESGGCRGRSRVLGNTVTRPFYHASDRDTSGEV